MRCANVMLQFLASSNETRGTSDLWRKAWGEVTNYDKLFSGMNLAVH